jgi:hypothetical protein
LGSSFDIYARNTEQLVSCSIYNAIHFYNVSCNLDNTIVVNNDPVICINVTVILYSENFDTFNQNAIDALPMIHIIKNDIEYCKENNKKNINYNTDRIPTLDKSFQIITGNWISNIGSKEFYQYNSTDNIVRRGYIFPQMSIHNEKMVTSTFQIAKENNEQRYSDFS